MLLYLIYIVFEFLASFTCFAFFVQLASFFRGIALSDDFSLHVAYLIFHPRGVCFLLFQELLDV